MPWNNEVAVTEGRIIRSDSGFHYIYAGGRLYECRMRGKAKRDHGKAFPGDLVEMTPTEEGKGLIETVKVRKNLLRRPAIANGDQLLIVMSLSYPQLDFNVLDRMLVIAVRTGLEPVLILNKADEAEAGLEDEVRRAYPLKILAVSARSRVGIEDLKALLRNRMSIFAGPSGVGKTSLLNQLEGRMLNPTGSLGEKIKRGRHTTRTTTFYQIGDGLLADTPGFSRVDLPPEMNKEDLPPLYREYATLAPGCQFKGCLHWREADCRVKDAVEEGTLDRGRYERYLYLLEELKIQEERRYK